METFVDHCKKGKEFRTEAIDAFNHASKKYRGKLDFSAYQYGHDPMYLGINGKINYGKIWGQTSASVQSLLDSNAFWKRIYYRKREEDDVDPEHKSSSLSNLNKSASCGDIEVGGGEGETVDTSSMTKGLTQNLTNPSVASSNNKSDINLKPLSPDYSTVTHPKKIAAIKRTRPGNSLPRTKNLLTKNINVNSDTALQYPQKMVPVSRVINTPPHRKLRGDVEGQRKLVEKIKGEVEEKVKKQIIAQADLYKTDQGTVLNVEEILENMSTSNKNSNKLNESTTSQSQKDESNPNSNKDNSTKSQVTNIKPGHEDEYSNQIKGYPFIRDHMKDICLYMDRPYFPKNRPNEPFTFFNTLGRVNGKYRMKGIMDIEEFGDNKDGKDRKNYDKTDGSYIGGGNYKYSKLTHRTRPFEIKFIAGLSLRNDYNCITNDGIEREQEDY